MRNVLASKKMSTANEGFMAFLYNTHSCSATLWSCWITDPVCCVVRYANAVWFAWMWPSLLAQTFIFSTAFFLLVNGLVVHTPPVRSRMFFHMSYAVYRMNHHNQHHIPGSSQVKCFSHLLWYFLLLLELVVRYLDCFFECSLSGVLIQGFLLGGIPLSSSVLL